jgi:hypothetical protein
MERSIWHLRIRARRFAAGLVMCLAIGALMLAPPLPAFSQSLAPSGQAPDSTLSPAAPVAPAAPAVTPPAPARPAHNPGFLEELGKVLKDSASHLSSSWKGSQKTLEDLNAKTKDATESLTRVQSVITGRAACPMTAKWRTELRCRCRATVQGQGIQDRQEPRHRDCREMLGEGLPLWPDRCAG